MSTLRSMVLTLLLLCTGALAHAQVSNDSASVSIQFAPRTGTFTLGSEFQLPVYIDTEGEAVTEVSLQILFDPKLVTVVRPSGGKSLFDQWVEAPVYDNDAGVVTLRGRIKDGVKTASGLITAVTFMSRATGEAVFLVGDSSKVLLADGSLTEVDPERDRAVFTIVQKPQEGIPVFSETHPSSNKWYNNTSPVFTWAGDASVSDYSFEFNDIPSTIPDNAADTNLTTTSFENVEDGLWYFHIKARKNNMWYGTSHFVVKIDTKPPAPFTPTVESFAASDGVRAVLSFRTADSLSGVDRYEVGVIDADSPLSEKPVFVQTESPYSLPDTASEKVRVIVRAYDRAGNVEEGALTIDRALATGFVLNQYAMPILGSIIALLGLFVLYHFVFGHRSLRRMRNAMGSYEEDYTQVRDVPHRTLPGGRQFESRVLHPAPSQIETRKIATVSLEEEESPEVQKPPIEKVALPTSLPAPMTSFVHPPTMQPRAPLAPPPAAPKSVPTPPSPVEQWVKKAVLIPVPPKAPAKLLPPSPVEKKVEVPAPHVVPVPHMVVTPQEHISYTPPPSPAAEVISSGEPVIEVVQQVVETPASTSVSQSAAPVADTETPVYTLVRPANPPTKLSRMMVMPRAKPAPSMSSPIVYSAHQDFPDPVLPKHS